MFFLEPLVVLLFLASIQHNADGNQDSAIVSRLGLAGIQLLDGDEALGYLGGDVVENPPVHGDPGHGVDLSLRSDALCAQNLVALAGHAVDIGAVVQGHPFGELGGGLALVLGLVEIDRAVAEAICEVRETNSEGTVLVVVPVGEFVEGEGLMRLHGHIEEAGGSHCDGGYV